MLVRCWDAADEVVSASYGVGFLHDAFEVIVRRGNFEDFGGRAFRVVFVFETDVEGLAELRDGGGDFVEEEFVERDFVVVRFWRCLSARFGGGEASFAL